MANKKISSMATVPYKGSLLVPAVDTSLPSGGQNVNLLASSFAGSGGASTIDDLTDAGELTGGNNSFVGFNASGTPAAIVASVPNTIIAYNSSGVPVTLTKAQMLAFLGL
jgi:hypothetical protein